MVVAKLPLLGVALASCSSPWPKSTESVTRAPSGQLLPVTVTLPPAVAVTGVNWIAGAPPLGSNVVVGVTAAMVVGVVVAGVGVSDGAAVGVAVGSGVSVAVGGALVAVGVARGVRVAVGRGVAVGGRGVAVGVLVGAGVVAVALGVGVALAKPPKPSGLPPAT